MSSLQYSSYDGYGQHALKEYHYSQAVRVGDRIECSGQVRLPPPHFTPLRLRRPSCPISHRADCQGGWDPATNDITSDIEAQIAQAFENVELTLRKAGGQGWDQVYRVNSYHVPLDDKALSAMVKGLRKWCPNHKPLWTCVGVPELAFPAMKVEIEVVAHDPK